MFSRSAIFFFLLLSFLFVSCGSPSKSVVQPQILTAYSTSSALPWMNDLFACANERSVTVNTSADSPDISLRIGEMDSQSLPAYQIDNEEILIVASRESSVQNLSIEEAQALFAGEGDPSVQVWVYSSELDVQRLFEQVVMQGRGVSPNARVAANPQEMSDVLNSQTNAVGILPKHWKAGSSREVYSVGEFPVLALVKEEPQGPVRSLISCLQR